MNAIKRDRTPEYINPSAQKSDPSGCDVPLDFDLRGESERLGSYHEGGDQCGIE
jgi:hypothetical protein